ncbi:FadR/GntR family transcriptional regulator [Streptomyces sp. NBC_01465]|uniref:FadR/GntR family transcriptional regulator n=1 Tax=Streptomyces sp. NBC_01465 TaxID=2903878 RepID=UPI002E36385A|nr:FCD domain-containing protein [Streptomyces sp. NBC_01465]
MAVRRTTLADQVADEIIALIEETGLKPGDVIPPEGELAARFEVNRLAVREAIRTLSAREILVSSQGRPARVNVPTAKVFGQILRFRLRQESLSYDDVMDARRAIEGALAHRAADRHTAGEVSLDGADALLAEMAESADDRERFVDLDIAFHAEIAAQADNGMLSLLLDSLSDVLRDQRIASYTGHSRRGDSHETTVAAHRAILDAVRAGDADGATAAMDAHLAETEKDLHAPGH